MRHPRSLAVSGFELSVRPFEHISQATGSIRIGGDRCIRRAGIHLRKPSEPIVSVYAVLMASGRCWVRRLFEDRFWRASVKESVPDWSAMQPSVVCLHIPIKRRASF
jgi:hypothetical protein